MNSPLAILLKLSMVWQQFLWHFKSVSCPPTWPRSYLYKYTTSMFGINVTLFTRRPGLFLFLPTLQMIRVVMGVCWKQFLFAVPSQDHKINVLARKVVLGTLPQCTMGKSTSGVQPNFLAFQQLFYYLENH